MLKRYGQLDGLIDHYQPECVLDVGIWNGWRAARLMRWGEFLIGFDLFEENPSISQRDLNVKTPCSLGDCSVFLANRGSRHHLLQGDSRETVPRWSMRCSRSPDLAFLGGGHSAETIRSDFEAIAARCEVMILDDYYVGDIDTEEFGCNRVLESRAHTVLPWSDPVRDSDGNEIGQIHLALCEVSERIAVNRSHLRVVQ